MKGRKEWNRDYNCNLVLGTFSVCPRLLNRVRGCIPYQNLL